MSLTRSYTPCTKCGCEESPQNRPRCLGCPQVQAPRSPPESRVEFSILGKLRVMETKTEAPNPLSTWDNTQAPKKALKWSGLMATTVGCSGEPLGGDIAGTGALLPFPGLLE